MDNQIPDIKEVIKKRTSIRSFNGEELSKEDLKKLEGFINNAKNPFNVNLHFKILNAKEHNLSSPVVNGTNTYIACKVKKEKYYELAYGYGFEEMCLFATSINIGTVMLAASLSRKEFEKAMDVNSDEVMAVASPIGYKAEKMSMLETLMKKGLRSNSRKDFDKIFYNNDFNNALKYEDAGIFKDALEMMRLAPSSTNNQPWRAVKINNTIHFYEYKTMKDTELGDIQKLDVGIGLCHFDLCMKENGYNGVFIENEPNIEKLDKMQYCISYEVK